jgi:hypothetical protein
MTIDVQYQTPPNAQNQILVIDQLTPSDLVTMAAALTTSYRALFSADLARRALCVFLAHTALETGRWQKLHNWNIGNVKASLAYNGLVQYFRCNEIINGKIQWFDPYNPQTRFRAFKGPTSATEQYLRFLGMATRGVGQPNRYQAAFDAAEKGDVVGMVDELARAGYFTANVELYRRAVVALFTEYLRDLPSTWPTMEPAPRIESIAIAQETSGHSKLSNQDIHDILMLQIPLQVDWDELTKARDAEILDADLNESQ